MPAARNDFARQIEPADRRILVEVAQDVGELQRAAEMMRERDAFLRRHAENPHAEAPDRARDAVAIKIERREIGRPDVGVDIHLHAVDDVEEIGALQIEGARRDNEAGRKRAGGGAPA